MNPSAVVNFIEETKNPEYARVTSTAIPRIMALIRGFRNCLYQVQKFDSDPERRFAVLLEDENTVMKWFKPAKDQVRIYYSADNSYEPDFIVETKTEKLMCEPKRASEMENEEVQAKARAAVTWCRYASEHAGANGRKPWCYFLIPHDAITSSATLEGLMGIFRKTG